MNKQLVDYRSIPAVEIRAEVLEFAKMIEARLRENEWRGSYHNLAPHDVLRKLKNEVLEVETAATAQRFFEERLEGAASDAIVLNRLARATEHEASDLATYALILASNAARRAVTLTVPAREAA